MLTVALLTAFLAGAILMNVAKEEVPSDRDSSLAAFVCGELFGTFLLLGVTLLE